jgi:2-succinyl-5-enolpyruvyl-6-hydroxy-3-cyclohexene-1-carboxylate synthase
MTAQAMVTARVDQILAAFMAQQGRLVVLAPGSRSTPVALRVAQLAQEKQLELYVDVDERSAGFFALGLAKTHQQPVLLVCTSGTAAANFYPAICEAKISEVPLLVLTTDRPPELTKIGAPQALDQTHFYGQQVKAFWQLPLPSSVATEGDYTNTVVQRSVQTALTPPQGPIQLNLPLRKPLMPDLQQPFKPVTPLQQQFGTTTLAPAALAGLQGKRVLVIVGPHAPTPALAELAAVAKQLNWPVWGDPLSQLRGQGQTIGQADLLLKATAGHLPTDLQPEVVLRIGGTLVSAAIATWLQQQVCPIYQVVAHADWPDHTLSATMLLHSTLAALVASLANVQPAPAKWWAHWQAAQTLVATAVPATTVQAPLTELVVPQVLAHTLPANADIFVSNSMPIRDMDDFYQPQANTQRLFCNRGANGIDGIVSTALGMSTSQRPHYLITGDLALFHDLNGLMLTRRYPLQLTVILVNNQGGGIFSFLPQRDEPAYFETVFGTPQQLDWAQVASLYHGQYQQATTAAELTAALAQPVTGLQLIEIPTQRADNVAQHTAVVAAIQHKLKESGWFHG